MCQSSGIVEFCHFGFLTHQQSSHISQVVPLLCSSLHLYEELFDFDAKLTEKYLLPVVRNFSNEMETVRCGDSVGKRNVETETASNYGYWVGGSWIRCLYLCLVTCFSLLLASSALINLKPV